MPTAQWIGNLRVVVYPNDHRPPHVHVIGHGHEAVIELGTPGSPLIVRENYGFSRRDLAKIQRALSKDQDELAVAWENIHG